MFWAGSGFSIATAFVNISTYQMLFRSTTGTRNKSAMIPPDTPPTKSPRREQLERAYKMNAIKG
jgi:hypothetical protein